MNVERKQSKNQSENTEEKFKEIELKGKTFLLPDIIYLRINKRLWLE